MEKRFFRPPEANNGPMIESFDLGGLQMILSDPKCQIVRGLHLAPTPGG